MSDNDLFKLIVMVFEKQMFWTYCQDSVADSTCLYNIKGRGTGACDQCVEEYAKERTAA